MLFNSYVFIFAFLPVALAGCFLAVRFFGREAGTLWLVLASLFFYGWWDVCYVPLLLASIMFNYWAGRKIERHPHEKPWLILGLAVNLALLGYFKYTDFFLGTVNDVLGTAMFDLPHIVLPLGISFFTFTQSAYLIDAYRGETKGYSFLTYCEFVTIFPHLIAGPIINHKDMIPQFLDAENYHVRVDHLMLGLSIFVIGLFKKVMIADSLSTWVGEAFSAADSLTLLEAWFGALGYTFQLYFDFSGYSEMAIGLGIMLNLKFPMNFDAPYQSLSIIDFWRRWHMTLGLWVRNYLYIPMGGNRHGQLAKMRNLLVSMLLIGLWHGAGWTFVLWGGVHGILLVINHLWRRLEVSLPRILCWLLTFTSVVCCWVLFRADSPSDACAILVAMAGGNGIALPSGGWLEQHLQFLASFGITFAPMHISGSLPQHGLFLFVLLFLTLCIGNPLRWNWQALFVRHGKCKAFLLGCVFGITLLAMVGSDTEFLYFQF